MSNRQSIRGFSIIGMLITMACMAVLFAIMMTSINKRVTGQGSQQQGTVRTFKDDLYFSALYQSMAVNAMENKGEYTVPSEKSRSKDIAQNTTASLFSAMVMDNFTPAKQLISGNEYSGYVEEDLDYNTEAYNPSQKVFWDPNFKADLSRESNVSFAHMPLFGERFKKQWRSTMDSTVPLLGNRGPKDGVNSVQSYACGKDGVWRGHLVFGDGHITFMETPMLGNLPLKQGGPDNVFKMESGPDGTDAIMVFTKTMSKKGPELQFD